MEWLDQFQTAAIRYQLNFIGYALSMAQATRLPALGGYLNTAQRNLIDKQTDHRIWRYWALENLWGNLAADPDPIARENIMFTGFCAAQIAMYHAAAGRRDYDRPASFALRHSSGRNYDYDLAALIEALDRERRKSAFHLIACEPDWIYPLCNTIGTAATKAHDRMTGGNRWSASEGGFRRHLEDEFIDLAGRFVPRRCLADDRRCAAASYAVLLPERDHAGDRPASLAAVAARSDEGAKLGPCAGHRLFWRTDTGNYRFSRASAFAGTALAAVELGDGEVARLCLDALERECPAVDEADTFYRPNASVWSHAVARATHAQGVLTAVLYPGERAGRFRLGLSGLAAGGRYSCDGTEECSIEADRQGQAAITVALADRTEIRVGPRA